MAEEHVYGRHASGYEYSGYWRLSWGAIFCGLFVTLAVFLVLHLLGAGIGISVLDIQDRGDNPEASSFGIGAGIWWFICGLISLFAGGWVAGYLSNVSEKTAAGLHGLVVWSLMYIVMFWLITTVLASIVGGAIGLIGRSISTAGQVASSQQGQEVISQTMTTMGIDPNMLKSSIGQMAGPNTPTQDQDSMVKSVQNYLQGQRTPEERQQLVQSVAQSTGKTPEEANKMITNMEQKAQQVKAKAQQAKEEAKEVSQKAIKVSGGSLIGLAIIMIIGALAAIFGAVAGTCRYHEHTHTHTAHTHE